MKKNRKHSELCIAYNIIVKEHNLLQQSIENNQEYAADFFDNYLSAKANGVDDIIQRLNYLKEKRNKLASVLRRLKRLIKRANNS